MTSPATDGDTSHFSDSSPNEIVIATPHTSRVITLLGRRHAAEVESHPGVGLTRVLLDDVDAVADRFAAVLSGRRSLPGSRTQLRTRTALERVLAGVRLTFSEHWDGWIPRIGKNRAMTGGEAAPIKVIRGDGDPVADVPATALPAPRPGGAGITVGLLDTAVRAGLDYDGRLLSGSDTLGSSSIPGVAQGHGTFTTGLVHQQAADADLLVRGVLAGPAATATAWEVALALYDLVNDTQAAVQIVNMSLGCFTEDNRPPLVLSAAVDMVRDDVVLLAASGNHGRQRADQSPSRRAPLWPAALDGVVAVGGLLQQAGVQPSPFTPRTPWVTLLADGTDVVSTYLDGKVSVGNQVEQFDGIARWSGSSMASAVAAGRLAALAEDGDARAALARVLAGAPDPVLSVYSAAEPA